MRGLQMEIDIDAKLPKLKKEGRFQALRFISKIGQVTYDHIRFDGDNRIKKDVIGRYLTAESQVQDPSKLAIAPENYKFKYKGQHDRDGRLVHVFQLQPKRKAEGLFKGELWIDPGTYLPVRESGELVKNPSIFLKKVRFTREFEIRDGVAYPKHLDTVVDTRIAGKAELRISFSNFVRVEIADALSDRPNSTH